MTDKAEQTAVSDAEYLDSPMNACQHRQDCKELLRQKDERIECDGHEINTLHHELNTALEQRDQLRAALRKYGVHKRGCNGAIKWMKCTCGLSDALGGGE